MFTTKEEFLNAVVKTEENTAYIPAPVDQMRLQIQNGKPVLNFISGMNAAQDDVVQNIACRDIAAPSILARAHIAGSALGKLSESDYEMVINRCLAVNRGDIGLVTVVDEKVSAVLSDTYKHISARGIFEKMFGLVGQFRCGYVDDTGFFASSVMPTHVLGAYAPEYQSMTPVLEVQTSNTGHSAVNIVPKFVLGRREFICGSAMSVLHKGTGDLEQVQAKLDGTFALFKQSVARLEALKSMIVHKPVATFLNVAKKIGLPKRLAILAKEEFEDGLLGQSCTAYDVYIGLTLALDYASVSKRGNDVRFMQNLQEIIARALQVKNWNEAYVSDSSWQV